jgi:16S rRNA G966 N2-methylase RsmD
MVERDLATFRALAASRAALDAATVELKRADALEFLRAEGDVYDVVFVDPPYRSDFWPRLAPLLPRHLVPGALVYHEGAARPDLPPGWAAHREGRAGQVIYQLLKWDAMLCSTKPKP